MSIIIMMTTAASATTICLLQSPHFVPCGFPMELLNSVHHQFLAFSAIITIDSIHFINDTNPQTCLNPNCRSPTFLKIFLTSHKF